MADDGTDHRVMLAICVEASHQRGMGHLFRVLNLCEALRARKIPFLVFINSHAPSQRLLMQRDLPFESVVLDPELDDWQVSLVEKHGIDLWIDDRLDTSMGHAMTLKRCGIPRVTFDDRGDGSVLADLNVMALALDESELLPGKRVLRGPRYLVLNNEIGRYRRLRKSAGSIVVTLGGSDTYGVTANVVRMLKSAGRGATVILGPAFQHEQELLGMLDGNFKLKKNVPSLIEELSHHDLAVTGGGITPFEANASGLPCIVIANEEFEIPVGQGLEMLGGCVFAGHYSAIDARKFAIDLPIEKMSVSAMTHIDLLGTSRVVDEIESLL